MAFLNERGIETRDIPPILGHPIYSWVSTSEHPVSFWLFKSGFYVGCHHDLGKEDIDYIGDRFMEYFDLERK